MPFDLQFPLAFYTIPLQIEQSAYILINDQMKIKSSMKLARLVDFPI